MTQLVLRLTAPLVDTGVAEQLSLPLNQHHWPAVDAEVELWTWALVWAQGEPGLERLVQEAHGRLFVAFTYGRATGRPWSGTN